MAVASKTLPLMEPEVFSDFLSTGYDKEHYTKNSKMYE